MEPKADITVSIVEDDMDLRESISRYIAGSDGFNCIGAYPDGEQALLDIPKNPPNVVLMDINLPQMSGIECVARLKVILPKLQVVMLTVFEDTDQVYQALSAGACGYLVKRASPVQLLDAIREVCRGGAPMSSHIARKVVQSFQPQRPAPPNAESLSQREQEVLGWLAKGHAYKQIADEMNISLDTVRTYIRRIYEKLHVRSRVEAVVKYFNK
jgi:DNA-binding NarL/FixJ family response regulator